MTQVNCFYRGEGGKCCVELPGLDLNGDRRVCPIESGESASCPGFAPLRKPAAPTPAPPSVAAKAVDHVNDITSLAATKRRCPIIVGTNCLGVHCMAWTRRDAISDLGRCGMVPR